MGNETFEEEEILEDDELTLDDLNAGWIGNPPVGEEVIFVVDKLRKLVGTALIGKKKDGSSFKKNLSNVNYGYEIETSKGDKYTVAAWEIFGKMKSIMQKLGKINGVEVRIKHLIDGMKTKTKDDKYEVAAKVGKDFKVLNRETKEWE